MSILQQQKKNFIDIMLLIKNIILLYFASEGKNAVSV